MARTMAQAVAEIMANAEYCSRCDKDFIDENDKVAPNEQEIFWTGGGSVICQSCQDMDVDRYLDNYNA